VIKIGMLADVPSSVAVEIAAGEFADVATQLDGAMDAVATGWTGLAASDVYDGPGADRVHGAMDAPKTVARMVATEAKNARRVLDDYASTLADLATRRASLASDVNAHTSSMDDTFDDEDSIGARDTPGGRLADDVAKFNRDVTAADEECARRLRALAKYRGASAVTNALDFLSDDPAGLAMGLTTDIFKRVRRLEVAVDADFEEPAPVVVTERWMEQDYSPIRENGFLVRRELAQSMEPQVDPEIETRSHLLLVNDEAAAPTAVLKSAKIAGGALGIAGTAITFADAWSDQYQRDTQDHPEWTETHKRQSAAENTAIVGTASAAGGWGGALAGAEIGAAFGSIFPGPGTVIGGILGGAIGGMWGSDMGKEIGEHVKAGVDGMSR
jgi:hypothetical protein